MSKKLIQPVLSCVLHCHGVSGLENSEWEELYLIHRLWLV